MNACSRAIACLRPPHLHGGKYKTSPPASRETGEQRVTVGQQAPQGPRELSNQTGAVVMFVTQLICGEFAQLETRATPARPRHGAAEHDTFPL